MERRKLEELNLLDDFLFQELVTRGEEASSSAGHFLALSWERR